jgi:hypothetical protein
MNKLLHQSSYLNTVGKVSLPNSRLQSLVLEILYPLHRPNSENLASRWYNHYTHNRPTVMTDFKIDESC